jgi:DNA-binding NarL/FixJ family response regulator
MEINPSVGLGAPITAFPVPVLANGRQPHFAQDSSRPSGDASEPASGDAPMVLLVDDNEMTLSRARSALSAGCVVVGTARNGHAALEAAAALNPDVVVLDISMPGMNGFELARRLRAAGSTAQLVFLTVHEEEELILAAKKVGAIGYVVKTRLASDLELAVREARAGRPFQSPVRS